MKLKKLARSLALIGLGTQLAGLALAQGDAAKKLERVEITGSSIKRLKDQTALPVQVITASDLEGRGITTAEQMLSDLGINAAGADNATSNNNVFGGETDRLAGGAASANLRGAGAGSTLILLNGRRVSTYGLSGGSVDLNSIPMAAIDRIEILKDGASAIYGTDAIGGVINFILKKSVEGGSIRVSYADPLAKGGGTQRRASLTGGYGNLDTQGFNVMASVTFDKNDILRGSDRTWADGYQPEKGLSPNSSSHPFANILTGTGTALPSAGSVVNGTDPIKYTRINLLSLQGQCDAIPTGAQFQPGLWTSPTATAGAKAANIASGRYLCNTDYGSQYMLAAPKDAVNLVARGTLQLNATDTAFIELTGSRTKVKAEFVPSQFSTTAGAGNFYPVNGPYYLNLKNHGVTDFDPTKPISYRWRMQDAGNRVIENGADNKRLLVGFEGEFAKEWSYKAGASMASSNGYMDLLDGYVYSYKFNNALKTGKINPWVKPGEVQSAEGMALIEAAKFRGRAGTGRTTLGQVDGAISGDLGQLPAGPLGFAMGFDLRRETYKFSMPSNITSTSSLATTAATQETDVLLSPGNGTVPRISRDIAAIYTELAIPVFKGFDMQVALRHDEYSVVGGTTNPKLAFRWLPSESLLLRGSYNTGFRAPSPQQLNRDLSPRDFTGKFDDPVKCPADPTQCAIIGLDYSAGGNPDLKPERSRQATLGIVYSPLKELQLYTDYWRIDLTDRIKLLGITEIINNYSFFQDRFERDANGNVSIVRTGWVNAADATTRGFDWGASYQLKSGFGTWTAAIDGTHLLTAKSHALPTLPLVEEVGNFGFRGLFLKDKFAASLKWKMTDYSVTFSAAYKSGYKDQDMSNKGVMPEGVNTHVGAYTTFNLFGTYTGIKGLTLTAGLRNLFDKQPQFTHHDVDDVVGAGWDPRVADPFGRTLSLAATYKF